MSWKAERYQKKRIKHHMKNRCKGGPNKPENLLLIDEQREKVWHLLFKNLSLSESIELLIRLAKAKHHESVDPSVKRFYRLI